MTGISKYTIPRAKAGLDPLPEGQCPRCLSMKVLGPRVVRDGERWSYCYNCGNEWQVNKVRKGHKPSWNPKVRVDWE